MKFELEFLSTYYCDNDMGYDDVILKLLSSNVEVIWEEFCDPEYEDYINDVRYIVDICSVDELDRLEEALGSIVRLYPRSKLAAVGLTNEEEDDYFHEILTKYKSQNKRVLRSLHPDAVNRGEE